MIGENMRFFTFLLIVLSLVLSSGLLYGTTGLAWDKNGFAVFRYDDNHTVAQWTDCANTFSRYGFPMNFAVNLAIASADQLATIHALVAQGHECCDHTPDHTTTKLSFSTAAEAQAYSGLAGVDHITGRYVYLKYGDIYPNIHTGETTVSIHGNLITSTAPGAFGGAYSYTFIYIPTIDKLLLPSTVYKANSLDPDTMRVVSYWGETVNLGDYSTVPFHLLSSLDKSLRMDLDALHLLVARSQQLQIQDNLPPFQIWIQPGGNWAQARTSDTQSVCGNEFGYAGGMVQTDSSMHCFNEYNPQGRRAFGVNWGSFYDESNTLSQMKASLASGVACHKAVVGGGHYRLSGVTWQGYINRLDSLLAWCNTKQIPVLTYPDMIETLYHDEVNPNTNIFPSLDTDLDEDNIPDGITLDYGTVINETGPSGQSTSCISVTGNRRAFYIGHLYSIEKGANLLSFSAKASVAHRVQLIVSQLNSAGSTLRSNTFNFTVGTTWQNCIARFSIPDSINQVCVQIYANNGVSTSTMSLTDFVLRGNSCPDRAERVWPDENAIVTPDSLLLQWVSGALPGTGYLLSLSTSDGEVVIDSLDVMNATDFDISHLVRSGTHYLWKIIPYRDIEGIRYIAAGIQNWSFETAQQYPPASPCGLVISVESDSLHITWLPVVSDDHGNPIAIRQYTVYYSPSCEMDSLTAIATTNHPQASFPCELFTTSGFFTVRASTEPQLAIPRAKNSPCSNN
jgi:hypothetical protein